MKHANKLYNLIHTLSKQEKKSFKKYKQGKNSIYLQLFDALVKTKHYEEATFKKKYAKASFITNFSFQKNYLYNAILDFLNDYHTDVFSTIRKNITVAQILIGKKLYEQSLLQLEKIEPVVKSQEFFSEWFNILTMKRAIIELLKPNNYQITYTKLTEERIDLVKKMENYLKYDTALKTMKTLTSHLTTLTQKADLQLFHEIIQQDIFQDIEQALTLKAKEKFYATHIRYHYVLGNEKQVAYYLSQKVDFLEKHPPFLKDSVGNYLQSLGNLLSYKIAHFEWHGVEEKLNKFEHLPKEYISNPSAIFQHWHCTTAASIRSQWYFVNGQFEAIIDFEKHIQAKVLTHLSGIANMVWWVYFDLAAAYFAHHDMDKALEWILEFEAVMETNIHKDTQIAICILKIMTHAQLGNYRLLPHLTHNLKKLIQKENTIEKKVHKWFKNKFPQTELYQDPSIYLIFKEEIGQLLLQHGDISQTYWGRFLLTWLNSKTSERNFIELFQENKLFFKKPNHI